MKDINRERGKRLFIFREDTELLDKLDEAAQDRVMGALLRWFNGSDNDSLEGLESIVFGLIINKMKGVAASSYASVENGKKGGRKPRQKPNEEPSEKPSIKPSEKPDTKPDSGIPYHTSTITDTITDTNTDTKIDTSLSPTIVAPLKDEKQDEQKTKRKMFIPPELEDLQAYCKDKGLPTNECENFIDYYSSNGWKVGKNKMVNWRSALSHWIRRSGDTTRFPANRQHAELDTTRYFEPGYDERNGNPSF